MTRPWLSEPHHDGSALYVEPGPYALGDEPRVRVRVPVGVDVGQVVLRWIVDGEPQLVEAKAAGSESGTGDTWWAADLCVANPVTQYRFGFETGGTTRWLNGAGMSEIDVTDAADFSVSTHPSPPDWLADAVGYQIFPDRFARGSVRPEVPPWAHAASWDDPLAADARVAVQQWYGGDLVGIERHLDHLVELGVDLLYLTPFFPARSSHRYDAASFDRVDPLLGGDAALASLTAAAHRKGIRVIGDLTLNHTGDHHDWFERAQADASSPEAGFYMFRSHPDDYVAWYDVPTLPKLDHRSAELERRLLAGPDSVAGRWLRAPFELDGWRIDCANTTARHLDADRNADVARSVRATLAEVGRDPWLVAEHCYDASSDLDGSGWHGVMAYQWFTRPLAQWLAAPGPVSMMSARPLGRLDGRGAASSMRALAAGVPWAAFTASMTLLDSHDTARFRSIVGGDRNLHVAAMTMLLTFPGVPMIFAGSEVGVTGHSSDGGRRPFPWDTSEWDAEMYAATRELIELRRASHALRHGGLRWVDGDANSLTFLRESRHERMLVHIASAGGRAKRLACDALGRDGHATRVAGVLTAARERDELVITAGPGGGVWRLGDP
jgi:alpha-glucosidase